MWVSIGMGVEEDLWPVRAASHFYSFLESAKGNRKPTECSGCISGDRMSCISLWTEIERIETPGMDRSERHQTTGSHGTSTIGKVDRVCSKLWQSAICVRMWSTGKLTTGKLHVVFESGGFSKS